MARKIALFTALVVASVGAFQATASEVFRAVDGETVTLGWNLDAPVRSALVIEQGLAAGTAPDLASFPADAVEASVVLPGLMRVALRPKFVNGCSTVSFRMSGGSAGTLSYMALTADGKLTGVAQESSLARVATCTGVAAEMARLQGDGAAETAPPLSECAGEYSGYMLSAVDLDGVENEVVGGLLTAKLTARADKKGFVKKPKMTAKVTYGRKSYSFTIKSLEETDAGWLARGTTKKGASIDVRLYGDGASDGLVRMDGTFSASPEEPTTFVGVRNVFAERGNADAARLLKDSSGKSTVMLEDVDADTNPDGSVSTSVGAKGKTKFAARFSDGVKFSGSGTLLDGRAATGDYTVVPVYKATVKGELGGLIELVGGLPVKDEESSVFFRRREATRKLPELTQRLEQR